MPTVASRLTSTGTLIINGQFDEITTSTIRLNIDNQFASSFDEVSLSAGSILFDGTNDHLTLSTSTALSFGTGDFTVEARIKSTDLSTESGSIVAGLGPTNGDWMFALRYSTDLSWGRNHLAWDAVTTGVTFSTNTWYHVAVSRSAGTLRIFVDGISRYSAANSIAYNISNSLLAVGARQDVSGVFGPGRFFAGNISDLKITKGVGLYTSNFTPSQSVLDSAPTTSLLLNSLSSSTFITDNSSSRFDITNNNGATFSREGSFNRGNYSIEQRQLSNGQLQVAGLFDEYAFSIVTSGLVLYLDASNSRSYPGSGTTWTDISGNGFSGTLNNGPTYTSTDYGSIVFDGVDDYALANNTSLGAKFPSTSVSHFIWVYPTSAGQIVVELGTTTINSGWHDTNIEISAAGAFSFSTWHGSLANKVVSSAQSFNRWYYVGFTYGGTTLTAYINGSSIGTTTFTRQAPNPIYYALFANDSTNMGTFGYGGGRAGSFKVYNRALSAAEIQQNFEATRWRYGI